MGEREKKKDKRQTDRVIEVAKENLKDIVEEAERVR